MNKVTILGNIRLSWIDYKMDINNPDYFRRVIKKSTIYFLDGEIILRKKELPSKPFKKLHKESKINNNFITLDIETITVDRIIIPYLINAFDGTEHINSYNNNEDELFKEFIEKLLSKIEFGSKTIIYAHNLSTFDGVFLLKHLFTFGEVKPLVHQGRIISITFKVKDGKKVKTIVFKDSYLTLNTSLRKLGVAFDVNTHKGYFPYNLIDISYSGVFPRFECWTDISKNKWLELKNEHGKTMWNFELESKKYCKLDCESLHQVIIKFNELFFDKFEINIHSSLTGPSLAMKVYKTHFMPENTIYQMLGKVEFDIRKSYTGGAVDVYIPHNKKYIGYPNVQQVLTKNTKGKYIVLYYYDVNSLYPYVMNKYDMPIGKATAFLGNILKVDPEAFGYFYCEMTSPENIDHPIIQRRIKTKNGKRTVAGCAAHIGTWKGMIFSDEMDNAIKFGCAAHIILKSLKDISSKKEIYSKNLY